MARSSADFLELLRKHIREVRIDSGHSQVEFAEKVEGLHQSAIARLETGRSENVGIRTVYEIAQACGMSLSEIISKAEGVSEKKSSGDSWSKINDEVSLLSPGKRKWLAKIVKDILKDSTDN